MKLFSSFSIQTKQLRIASLTAAFLILIVGVGRIYAQSPWFSPTKEEHDITLEQCKEGDVGLECTVHAVVSNISHSLTTEGIGFSTDVSQRPGAVFLASRLVGVLLSSQPVSSEEFVQYTAQRLNPVEKAYAQGAGYQALEAFIPVWAAFRNTAYLAFVVIFIFIGFMIMFRARLDPQTVVNIQNSLPKLVITLILITFSYAIAGLMVDLLYLGIYLAVSIFASQGLIGNAASAREALIGKSLFQMIFEGSLWRYQDKAGEAVANIVSAAIPPGFLQKLLDFLGGTLGPLIITIAIIFSVFKLFFQLGIAYIQIILLTLLSPLFILMNALPGSQSFSNWIRNFLSNVIPFPAVALIFILAAVIQGPTQAADDPFDVQQSMFEAGETAWVGPFLVTSQNLTIDMVLELIGFFLIISAPQIISVLQKSLKAQPLPVAGVFAPIAAGGRIFTAPFRGAGGAITSGARIYFGEKVERAARAGEVAGGR